MRQGMVLCLPSHSGRKAYRNGASPLHGRTGYEFFDRLQMKNKVKRLIDQELPAVSVQKTGLRRQQMPPALFYTKKLIYFTVTDLFTVTDSFFSY